MRNMYKHFLKNNLVFTIMGLCSVCMYISKDRMSVFDKLEDIKDGKGTPDALSEKIIIFMAYSTLGFATLCQVLIFIYSIRFSLGYSNEWFHGR